MPKITAISPQTKRKERFNIFLDGAFAFGTDAESVILNHLKVGRELTQDEIAKITKKEELTKLFDKTLNFLSFRPRSEKEIIDYLTKKIAILDKIKFSEAKESQLIVDILDKLKKYKYVNDLDFAKWWVDARKNRPIGIQVIKGELIRKGISREMIEKVLVNIDQKKLAKKALEKKINKFKNLSQLDFKKKVYQYLYSKGFPLEIIKDTFAIYSKKR